MNDMRGAFAEWWTEYKKDNSLENYCRVASDAWCAASRYLGKEKMATKDLHIPEEFWSGSDIELTDEQKSSIEIGETNKSELYLKSLKQYHGNSLEDALAAVDKLFTVYDEVKMYMNARKG